jgi:hypothetical protein
MFRRSGYRFADKNMRQIKKVRAYFDSVGTKCALTACAFRRPRLVPSGGERERKRRHQRDRHADVSLIGIYAGARHGVRMSLAKDGVDFSPRRHADREVPRPYEHAAPSE